MKSIKAASVSNFTVVFAICGFVLSLICGLFSRSGFGKILITAVVSALVFAVLAVLIKIAFKTLLKVDSSDTAKTNATVSDATPISPVGQHIDFVVEDQELEEGESSNHFDVGNNRQMLDDSDVQSTKSLKEEIRQSTSDFVPIRKLETLTNISGTESESIVPAEKETSDDDTSEDNAEVKTLHAPEGELDVLPDLSDSVFNSEPVKQSASESYDSDASDDGFVDSSLVYKSKEDNSGEIKDSSLMAKAISSILAQES